MRVLLIRHGHTEAVGRYITGRRPGLHLTAEGHEQARRLAMELRVEPIAAIYTSPLERTVETAAPLAAQFGLNPRLTESIVEVEFGAWTGRTLEELEHDEQWRRWNTFRSSSRAPGGESMIEVQRRMVDFIRSLESVHRDETVALVSHGDPIRATAAHYLGVPLDLFLRIEIDPASVTAVEISDWGPKVRYVNRPLTP